MNHATNRVETELKFSVPDAETFAALRRLTELGDFQLRPLGTKTISDRYLDADQKLLQAGLACRIRQSGPTQLLTLKSLAVPDGNLHRRQEIEQEVTSDQPQSWPDGEAKTLVTNLIGESTLATLFVLRQTRHKFHVVVNNQPVLEVSLDEVSHGDQEPIDYYELEAELLPNADESVLTDFTRVLLEQWSLPPEHQSKFERGLAYHRPLTMFQLSDLERSALEQLAAEPTKILARPAMIILMSEAGATSTQIAQEGEVKEKVVKHWQTQFREKRLDIFPKGGSAGEEGQPAETAQAGVETEPAASPQAEVQPKQRAAKKKSSSKRPAIRYPVRKKIGLSATDSLAEAGRKVLGFQFARMLKYEPGTRRGKDIEALHDMRVATRRLRAAFRVFEAGFSKKAITPLLDGLKATGRALGPVRDYDVFMEKLEHYQATLPEAERANLQPLFETWAAKRRAAREQMLAYLDSKKYFKFKQNFLEFVETEGLGAKRIPNRKKPTPYQLCHVAPTLISESYAHIRAFEPGLDSAPIETLHQLRIAFKRFRYTVEYLQEVLDKEAKAVIEETKAMQDHLGSLQDADVATGILQRFLVEWEQHQLHLPLAERRSSTQIVAYLNYQLGQRQQLLTTFPAAWAHFNRPEFKHKLAKAIAIL
jgi:CHAD domain-containing protein/uncharacterized protein YjbK